MNWLASCLGLIQVALEAKLCLTFITHTLISGPSCKAHQNVL